MSDLSYKLIQENKPQNPCAVHNRELLIDLYNQAKTSPAGPWVLEQSDKLMNFSCTLCGCKRLYKLMTQKTLL